MHFASISHQIRSTSRNSVAVVAIPVRVCSTPTENTCRCPECQSRSENATRPLPAQSRYLDIPQCANATHIKRPNHMRAYGATRRPRGDWRARHPFQRRTPFEPI